MTFASLEFAGLLALTLALYYFLPQRARMLLLLAASYVFYCYWNPVYGLLILASTVLDYAMALVIGRAVTDRCRRLALLAGILGNLGMLSYFKYTDFALDSLRALLGPLGQALPGPLNLILPVGISFYTFQTMSYTIDVYRGEKKPERDFILVALYVSFFPQLVAGPIERAKSLMSQLRERQAFSLRNVEEGGRLILWGLLKKVVVGDRLTGAAYRIYLDPSSFSTGELAFAALGMFVVIYLDFSAYSQIARGTARLFGIRLTVNFNFPDVSLNIAEFWRRWHITMSTWVRDYLFKPLGGFTPRDPWRHGRTTMITMGLVGLWHGAKWTFVIWGLAHGIVLIGYQLLHMHILRTLRNRAFLSSRIWRLGSWALNTLIRVLLSILFFSPDFARARVFFSGLCVNPTRSGFGESYVRMGFTFVVAFWVFHYAQYRIPMVRKVDACHPFVRGSLYAVLLYAILFGAVETAGQFIYYQF